MASNITDIRVHSNVKSYCRTYNYMHLQSYLIFFSMIEKIEFDVPSHFFCFEKDMNNDPP